MSVDDCQRPLKRVWVSNDGGTISFHSGRPSSEDDEILNECCESWIDEHCNYQLGDGCKQQVIIAMLPTGEASLVEDDNSEWAE